MTNTANVLVIEDNTLLNRLIGRMLEQAGYNVSVIESAEALDDALQTPPDLILSDYNLPGTTGIAISRQLSTNPSTSSIPVILMSGMPDLQWQDTPSVCGILHKPFLYTELLSLVHSMIPLPVSHAGVTQN